MKLKQRICGFFGHDHFVRPTGIARGEILVLESSECLKCGYEEPAIGSMMSKMEKIGVILDCLEADLERSRSDWERLLIAENKRLRIKAGKLFVRGLKRKIKNREIEKELARVLLENMRLKR